MKSRLNNNICTRKNSHTNHSTILTKVTCVSLKIRNATVEQKWNCGISTSAEKVNCGILLFWKIGYFIDCYGRVSVVS